MRATGVKLTRRERSVLRLIAVGMSSSQIAAFMGFSKIFAERVARHLRNKFRVESTRQLPIIACSIGLVDPEMHRILGKARVIEGVPRFSPDDDKGPADGDPFLDELKRTKGFTDKAVKATIKRLRSVTPRPR